MWCHCKKVHVAKNVPRQKVTEYNYNTKGGEEKQVLRFILGILILKTPVSRKRNLQMSVYLNTTLQIIDAIQLH